jgi:hypothetical protein
MLFLAYLSVTAADIYLGCHGYLGMGILSYNAIILPDILPTQLSVASDHLGAAGATRKRRLLTNAPELRL